MKRIMPYVGAIFFGGFSVAIVVFLLSLSWSALSRIFPGNVVNQLFGLANFDFAALGWLLSFVYVARGYTQRSLAFVMFLVSLVGTLIIVALEIGLSTGWFDMAAVMVPLSIVLTVMTFLHMAAIYFFHLNDPEVSADIEAQADEDSIIEQARRDTTAELDRMRPELARTLASGQVAAALRSLGLAAPLVVEGRVLESSTVGVAPKVAPKEAPKAQQENGAPDVGAPAVPTGATEEKKTPPSAWEVWPSSDKPWESSPFGYGRFYKDEDGQRSVSPWYPCHRDDWDLFVATSDFGLSAVWHDEQHAPLKDDDVVLSRDSFHLPLKLSPVTDPNLISPQA